MTSRFTRVLVLLPLALACGSGEKFKPAAPFGSDKDVQAWATTASAVAVYSHGYEPIAAADGQAVYMDPACPETSDDGTELSITGGCTDTNNREWRGRAVVVRDGDDRTVTFDDFNGDVGTMHLRLVSPSLHEFDAELVSGDVTTISYEGTVEGDYGGPTVWNGSGRVEREGFLPPTGVVDATTQVQLIDNDVCGGQPLSGTTTLESGHDTAVITYDGATDCDADQKARLSVNGKDRGLIADITCSIGDWGRKGASSVPAYVLAMAALLASLRRRHRED